MPLRLRRGVLPWLGKLWASPVTLLGLLLGLLGLVLGSRLRVEHNALVFHRYPFGPGGALVLGNVILSTLPSLDVWVPTYSTHAEQPHAKVWLADHERAHTYPYAALGVLFLPLYLLAGGISARNRFESATSRSKLAVAFSTSARRFLTSASDFAASCSSPRSTNTLRSDLGSRASFFGTEVAGAPRAKAPASGATVGVFGARLGSGIAGGPPYGRFSGAWLGGALRGASNMLGPTPTLPALLLGIDGGPPYGS